MATNNNLQQIHLGAPTSIEVSQNQYPNAELSVQFMGLCEELTLHDNGSKCTKDGAMKTAAFLIKKLLEEKKAQISGEIHIQPLTDEFVLNGGTTRLHCLDLDGKEVQCVWMIDSINEYIGQKPTLSNDGVITITDSSFAYMRVKCISFEDSNDVSLLDIVAGAVNKYLNISTVLIQYPSIAMKLAQYNHLSSIIEEWPNVVNSIIDTGQRNVLSNSVGAFFNTGVNAKNDPRSVIEMSLKNNSDVDYFGNNYIGGSCYLANFHNYDLKYYRYGTLNSIATNTQVSPEEWHVWDIGKDVYLDGELKKQTGQTYVYSESQTPIYIYKSYRGNPSTYNIASFKIYDGDELVRYFVPFVRNGKNGLIDVLSNIFYDNQGSGSITITTETK